MLVWVWILGGISRFLLFRRLSVCFRGWRVSAAYCSVVCIWISFLCEAIVGLVGCNEVLCYLGKQSVVSDEYKVV